MTMLRRALFLTTAVELPLVVLIAIWGIPSPFTHNPVGEILEATHAPGIALLETINLCCGYVNSLVISDVWAGPVQKPSLAGLALLAGSNILVLTGITFLALLARRARKRRTDAAAA